MAIFATGFTLGTLLNPTEAEAVSAAFSPALILSGLVGAGMFIPLTMAYFFAPVLIAIDGFSALDAMKLSFASCLRNVLPFFVYGVIVALLSLLSTLLLGLGFLVSGPVLILSMYVAYRDIFHKEIPVVKTWKTGRVI